MKRVFKSKTRKNNFIASKVSYNRIINRPSYLTTINKNLKQSKNDQKNLQ